MRVLWFCTVPLSDSEPKSTGTWLGTMAHGLAGAGQVELAIIALGSGRKLSRQDCGAVRQYLVPVRAKSGRDGLPCPSLLAGLLNACEEFQPDLIHVWGTEWYWGLLPSRGLLKAPSVLTLQGVKYSIAPHCHGGMTIGERLASTGLREAAKVALFQGRHAYFSKGERWEREIMRGHRWAICQTPWQEAQMLSNRPDAKLFHLDLPLRPAFEQSEGWSPPATSPTIFTIAPAPSKGLHVAVRAVALLRHRFPEVQLRIAGLAPNAGIHRDGYLHWIAAEISRLEMTSQVKWLGSLSAVQIAEELRSASAMVVSTFIESYCMAFAEAMRVGTPAVVSFTGGTAYLGKDEESCLFVPPGDAAMCAYQLERVLSNRDLAMRLSANARQIATERHEQSRIVREQLRIYQHVIADSQRSSSC